jgi:hypothetical protein
VLPLFTELPMRRMFPETRLPAYRVLGNQALNNEGHPYHPTKTFAKTRIGSGS